LCGRNGSQKAASSDWGKSNQGGQGGEGRPGGWAEVPANRSSRAKTQKEAVGREEAEQSKFNTYLRASNESRVYATLGEAAKSCFQKVKIASARSKVHAHGNPLLNGNQGEWVGIGEG